MLIDKCPICEGVIQSHTVVTKEYEGVTLRLTKKGSLYIEDEGELVNEDYNGVAGGTEVYCENDHSDLDMEEHLREMAKCDDCGGQYQPGDRMSRCGDCGRCGGCCDDPREGYDPDMKEHLREMSKNA
jgi:hypothetical protein